MHMCSTQAASTTTRVETLFTFALLKRRSKCGKKRFKTMVAKQVLKITHAQILTKTNVSTQPANKHRTSISRLYSCPFNGAPNLLKQNLLRALLTNPGVSGSSSSNRSQPEATRNQPQTASTHSEIQSNSVPKSNKISSKFSTGHARTSNSNTGHKNTNTNRIRY